MHPIRTRGFPSPGKHSGYDLTVEGRVIGLGGLALAPWAFKALGWAPPITYPATCQRQARQRPPTVRALHVVLVHVPLPVLVVEIAPVHVAFGDRMHE